MAEKKNGNFQVSVKVGMLLSSVITAILIHLNRDNLNASMSMTTVIFVLIFVIFFQFGVGPIPPFITSELFVTAQRYFRNTRNKKSPTNFKATSLLNNRSCELDFKYDYRCSLSTCQSGNRRSKFSYFWRNHFVFHHLCDVMCSRNQRKNNKVGFYIVVRTVAANITVALANSYT